MEMLAGLTLGTEEVGVEPMLKLSDVELFVVAETRGVR